MLWLQGILPSLLSLAGGKVSSGEFWSACHRKRDTRHWRQKHSLTFSAMRDVVCCSMISWYSSRISLDMQSWNLPARKAFHIGRYGLWSEMICTRQLVSMTTFRIAYFIYKVYGNGRSEGFGASARSILQIAKAVPSLYQSDGHRNLPTGLSAGLTLMSTLYATSK